MPTDMRNDMPSAGVARSLYRAVTDAGPDHPRLETRVSTEVAIIGGGFTGLSTALHLAEAGVQSVVLEAGEVGWGASGRNGGQINPGLKSDPDEIVRDFGEKRGARLIEMAGKAPAYLFDLVRRYDIDCAALNSGTIRVMRRASEAETIDRSIRSWASFGVELERLDASRLAALTGTQAYPVGLLDRRGGQLNPLAYARGLARVAAKLGVSIFTGSRAVALRQNGARWLVTTPNGAVEADKVVLATNGYTDGLWPKLRETVVPVYSAIAATDPLPRDLLESMLPGRQVVYESSWRVLYFRIDDAGRFLMGGPSVLHETADERRYQHLIRYARELFPALAEIPFRHFWNGQVAVTKDHYPHLHEPAAGVIAALGYNGRGVAMATSMGGLVARRLRGAAPDELELPITPIRPFSFHPMWKPVVTGRRLLGAMRDRFHKAAD